MITKDVSFGISAIFKIFNEDCIVLENVLYFVDKTPFLRRYRTIEVDTDTLDTSNLYNFLKLVPKSSFNFVIKKGNKEFLFDNQFLENGTYVCDEEPFSVYENVSNTFVKRALEFIY